MPLPRSLTRRPTQLLFALLAIAVAATVGIVSVGGTPSNVVAPQTSGVLVVADKSYEFDLDTCFVGNDSFVVAGHGKEDSDEFRVLASPSEIELAFGITDQAAPVPEDSLWLGTTEPVEWSADDGGVTARVQLANRFGNDLNEHEAELRVDCGATP
jgi:hypothetical protein